MVDFDDTQWLPPQAWVDALVRSKADLAAGRVVDGAEIHWELQETITKIEIRR